MALSVLFVLAGALLWYMQQQWSIFACTEGRWPAQRPQNRPMLGRVDGDGCTMRVRFKGYITVLLPYQSKFLQIAAGFFVLSAVPPWVVLTRHMLRFRYRTHSQDQW